MALSISIVYGFAQCGPLYIIFPNVGLRKSPVFIIIKLVYYFTLFQWMLYNGRTCMLLTTGMSISLFRILRRLKSKPVYNPGSINVLLKLYREISLVLSLLGEHTNSMLGKCLTGCYFIIAVGPCCSILSLRSYPYKLSLAFILTSIMAFGSVLFVFKYCSNLLSSSRFILKRWKDGCKEWRNFEGKVCYRKVISCRLLVTKAGNISVISNKLAQGYFNSLLLDCMNVFIISSAYWTPT